MLAGACCCSSLELCCCDLLVTKYHRVRYNVFAVRWAMDPETFVDILPLPADKKCTVAPHNEVSACTHTVAHEHH
jgi:hypothetical protein